ncbi:MAG: glycosyltransferase family 2 protein [Desulfobacterales bacterium]|nr:glycosyltransferase family 2 protein [Desulfobacterales bacterium]
MNAIAPIPPSPQKTAGRRPMVSVIVPAFNEAESIPLLHGRVAAVLDAIVPGDWELIFVDDGSRDATWAVISSLAEKSPAIRGARLSRNFGHQYALMAGMEMAAGEAVISMDCDLQHPVEMLPVLIAKWREGFKVVKTLREDDRELGWFKRVTSRGFYRLFSYLSGVKMQPGMADFRLLDRQALNELMRFREEGLFLRGLTEWIGFASCAVPYRAAERACGRSRYSFRKMVSLAWRGVSSFSILPLRLGIMLGLIGSVVSAFGVFYAFYGKIFGYGTVPGWASTLMVVSLLFSLLFVYLGILGEYIGRIVIEVRRRPRFIVGETTGRPRRDPPPPAP